MKRKEDVKEKKLEQVVKQINKGRIQKTMIMTAITAIQRGARLGTSESIKPCE